LTTEGNIEARNYFLRASEIDPGYARAYAALALSYGQSIVFRLSETTEVDIARGLEFAETAESLDDTLPQTQFARAVLLLASRRHDEAVAAARRAVELDRSYADGYAVLAQTSAYSGQFEDALRAIRIARTLNPRHTFSYLWVEGHILYQLRRYAEALPILEDVVQRNPSFYVGMLTLSATYGQLGMVEKAEWLNTEISVLSPGVSAAREGDEAPYRRAVDRDHFVEGLLMAALPR
jgi:tetratricopeptide (TPR) repeat protein